MEPIKTIFNSGTSNISHSLVCGNSSLNAVNPYSAGYHQNWNWVEPLKTNVPDYNSPITITATGTTSLGILTINNNNIMQNKVAVFKVTRDENQKITSTKFIKELWIESKNGSSIDFEVAKDSEINKFEANEIVIKVIYTVTF